LCGSFGNGADILLDIADEKHCHPASLAIFEKRSEIPTFNAQNALPQPVDSAEVAEVSTDSQGSSSSQGINLFLESN
jgi:hypothetical protein